MLCTFSFFSVSSFKEADSDSRVSRASPLTMLAGGVAPFSEPRRAAAVPFMEAVTRGETAERAVAPLAMEAVGVVEAAELAAEDVRREAGVALAGAVVAMACRGRVCEDWEAEGGGPALGKADERRVGEEEVVVAKAWACAGLLDGSTSHITLKRSITRSSPRARPSHASPSSRHRRERPRHRSACCAPLRSLTHNSRSLAMQRQTFS